MLITVHSTLKEAKPKRALFMAIGLLVVTTGLAYRLTQERAREPLSGITSFPTMPIEFRLPKGFGLSGVSPPGDAVQYVGKTPSRKEAALTFWRVPRDKQNELAEYVRIGVMTQHAQWTGSEVALEPKERRGNIGKIEGEELAGIEKGFVARIAELNHHETYAISLSVRNGEIDERTYELFDLTCRSVSMNSSGRR